MTTAAAAMHDELPNNTYHLAQRLQGIATDSHYTFAAGTRALDTKPIACLGDFCLTGTFTVDDDTRTATVWARDRATGTLQAAAQARATLTRHRPAASINARILHFRKGPLLWTGTPPGQPVAYTCLGAYPYRLEPVYRLGAEPHWILTATGRDLDHPQFAGILSALSHITGCLEPPLPAAPARAGRRRR